MGSVLGAFIGDAMGAPLEFSMNIIEESKIYKAMNWIPMYEQAAHATAPGQITDDSEMALCLAYGLQEGAGVLNLNLILKKYAEWFHKSQPFGRYYIYIYI